MHTAPRVTAADLAALGPHRLIHVPIADERPDGLLCVPIEDWTRRAKRSQSGLDDLAFWQPEREALGVGPDAVSVVLDDGRMPEGQVRADRAPPSGGGPRSRRMRGSSAQ